MVNKLVFENLKHRPVRTLLSAIVIGVQVTTILTLVGLSRGMLEDSARRIRGTGADIMVRPPGSTPVSLGGILMLEKFVSLLDTQPHIAASCGFFVQPIGKNIESVTGIDLERFNRLSGGFRYLEGGPFQRPDDIIADQYYAEQNKWRTGQTVRLFNHPWRVAGIVEPGNLAHIVVPLSTLQDLTGNTGKVTQILVKVDQHANIESAVDSLRTLLPEFKIYPLEELLSLFSVNNIPELRTFIRVIIGLGVIVGFLVVFLSMYTAVLERTREIGILKALGASPAFVLGMLVRETVVLALFGSVVGVLLAYVSRAMIMTYAPATLPVVSVPDWWPIAGGIALAGALLGAIYPGMKAARQDAIEALAYD